MDYEDSDNNILKYECKQCLRYCNILIWKKKYSKVGYLCQDCWNTYFKRLEELRYPFTIKNK